MTRATMDFVAQMPSRPLELKRGPSSRRNSSRVRQSLVARLTIDCRGCGRTRASSSENSRLSTSARKLVLRAAPGKVRAVRFPDVVGATGGVR